MTATSPCLVPLYRYHATPKSGGWNFFFSTDPDKPPAADGTWQCDGPQFYVATTSWGTCQPIYCFQSDQPGYRAYYFSSNQAPPSPAWERQAEPAFYTPLNAGTGTIPIYQFKAIPERYNLVTQATSQDAGWQRVNPQEPDFYAYPGADAPFIAGAYPLPGPISAELIWEQEIDALIVSAGNQITVFDTKGTPDQTTTYGLLPNVKELVPLWAVPVSSDPGTLVSEGKVYWVDGPDFKSFPIQLGPQDQPTSEPEETIWFTANADLLPATQNGDFFYLLDEEGTAYKIRKQDGNTMLGWKTNWGSPGRPQSVMVTDGNKVVFIKNDCLYVMDCKDGALLWASPSLPLNFTTPPGRPGRSWLGHLPPPPPGFPFQAEVNESCRPLLMDNKVFIPLTFPAPPDKINDSGNDVYTYGCICAHLDSKELEPWTETLMSIRGEMRVGHSRLVLHSLLAWQVYDAQTLLATSRRYTMEVGQASSLGNELDWVSTQDENLLSNMGSYPWLKFDQAFFTPGDMQILATLVQGNSSTLNFIQQNDFPATVGVPMGIKACTGAIQDTTKGTYYLAGQDVNGAYWVILCDFSQM